MIKEIISNNNNRYIICILFSIYIIFNLVLINLLPGTFFRALAWIGNEERIEI